MVVQVGCRDGGEEGGGGLAVTEGPQVVELTLHLAHSEEDLCLQAGHPRHHHLTHLQGRHQHAQRALP